MVKLLKIRNYKINFLVCFFVFIFFSNINYAQTSRHNDKNNFYIDNCGLKQKDIICINFKIDSKFKVNLLNGPYRILLNFEKKIILNHKFIKEDFLNNSLIKDIRFNQNFDLGSRLALELNKPAIISKIYSKGEKSINNNINLQIQLSQTTKTSFAIAKHLLAKNNGNIFVLVNKVISQNKKKESNLREIKHVEKPIERPLNFNQNANKNTYIVFIDPGHGGKDPGAIGKLGTLEKNVTLQTSKLLEKHLKSNLKIYPILSRYDDSYLSLRDRIKLAKINKADVFISIHADASKNKNANGVSVFSLSDKASDKEAQMLAKRENEVDKTLGLNNNIKDPIIYDTLIKMFQREAMNDSAFLAKNIMSNLEKTGLALNRGHRFAGFTVLKSYDIPSVLIEIGFLSNKREEKKLLDKKYLNELSKGLAIAIENYFFKKK